MYSSMILPILWPRCLQKPYTHVTYTFDEITYFAMVEMFKLFLICTFVLQQGHPSEAAITGFMSVHRLPGESFFGYSGSNWLMGRRSVERLHTTNVVDHTGPIWLLLNTYWVFGQPTGYDVLLFAKYIVRQDEYSDAAIFPLPIEEFFGNTRSGLSQTQH